MSSWQIACSLFSPLRVPVDFIFSGALMINWSASDFLTESHLYVHCCLFVWPNPQSKCNHLLPFPPSSCYHPSPPSSCVWIRSPPTLPMTGPSVWPPLNCCRLEHCHSGSCCIVFGNGAYGTWTGKWVCEDAIRVWLQQRWAFSFIWENQHCVQTAWVCACLHAHQTLDWLRSQQSTCLW